MDNHIRKMHFLFAFARAFFTDVLFITHPNEIVGTYAVKAAERDQILYFQFGSAFLNVAVSLL